MDLPGAHRPNERVVYLVGDYDVRRNRELKGLLLATEPATPLVVDCGSVRFMDSTGLSTLIEARLTLIERGSRLDLRNIPESLHAVFRVTGLEETFGGGLA